MLHRRLFALVGAIFCGALSLSVCAQSLYDDLGGELAIECWIDEALPILIEDPRIGDFFAGDLNAGQAQSLRDSLVEFACAASGGRACTRAGAWRAPMLAWPSITSPFASSCETWRRRPSAAAFTTRAG